MFVICTCGAVPKVLFTVRFVSVDPVKSTVWAAVPFSVTVPVELIVPAVLAIFPPTLKPLAPIERVPAVSVKLPLAAIAPLAVTCGDVPEVLFTVRFVSVDPVKSTVCAAVPFSVTVPVELIAPAVLAIFPPTLKPLAPIERVPAVSVKLPLAAIAPLAVTCGDVPEVLFTVRFVSVDPVKSTVCAAVPFSVTVPVELIAPAVLAIFPPTLKPLAPIERVPAVSVKLPLAAIAPLAVTCGDVPEVLFTVRFVSVDPVKSTVCAAVPFSVTVPVELIAPAVLAIFPPTLKPLAPIERVPAVSVKLPLAAIAPLAVTCGDVP